MRHPRGHYPPMKTGAGRRTTKAGAVPDVESVPCPAGGTHRLANSPAPGGVVTACVGCGKSWSEIDAEARG